MRHRHVGAVALLLVVAGCASPAAPPPPTPHRITVTAATGGATRNTVASAAASRYAEAVDAAVAHGLAVWIEADMVKRWQQGGPAFDAAVAQVAALAGRPGVAGIKIADELGYRDGLERSPAAVTQFLHETAAALRQAAPGRPLLADMVIPELGCAPGMPAVAADSVRCTATAAAGHPALDLRLVDGYLAPGDLDVLDVSTGLLEDAEYSTWGIDRSAAQEAAWHEIARRGWARRLSIQGRKALAHPGDYQGGTTRSGIDLGVFVDVPLRDGARAVDIWAWRQQYQGGTYRLMDSGLRSNSLWQGIRSRRDRGARLFTHFSPSSVERSLDADLATVALAFTDVFMAAGTG